MKHWLKNSLFIGLIAFIACFGNFQWQAFNPKEPFQAGRIAFEWHLPKDKTALNKGQQNLGQVWQWILNSSSHLQHQLKHIPWRFSTLLPMESGEKKAQR
jgi:hypothetical protein